jgi:hypothetical protein
MLSAIRRTYLVLVGIPFVSLVCVNVASAQSEEDRAAARALANQGITAFSEGRYDEAVDRFARAESLLHAPTHLLYLGRCAEKQGQLIRARELLLKLSREELPANAPQAFRDAQNQAQAEARALESRLASVVITVKSPADVKPKVEMDGKLLPAAVLGVAVPADPGKHEFTASAPGYQSEPVVVTLVEGGKGKVELTVVESAGVTRESTDARPTGVVEKSAPPRTVSEAPLPEASRAWMRPTSFAALGVGAIGLGAGIYFGLDSRSTRKDADAAQAKCDASPNGCLSSDAEASEISRLDDEARKSLKRSVASFAVSIVGVSVGTVLYVLSPKKSSPERTASVVPWVGLGSAGVSGTW